MIIKQGLPNLKNQEKEKEKPFLTLLHILVPELKDWLKALRSLESSAFTARKQPQGKVKQIE